MDTLDDELLLFEVVAVRSLLALEFSSGKWGNNEEIDNNALGASFSIFDVKFMVYVVIAKFMITGSLSGTDFFII